MAYKILFAADF